MFIRRLSAPLSFTKPTLFQPSPSCACARARACVVCVVCVCVRASIRVHSLLGLLVRVPVPERRLEACTFASGSIEKRRRGRVEWSRRVTSVYSCSVYRVLHEGWRCWSSSFSFVATTVRTNIYIYNIRLCVCISIYIFFFLTSTSLDRSTFSFRVRKRDREIGRERKRERERENRDAVG